MKATKPFGDLTTASILVIGHDPRLQRSQAQAETAFFMHYLAGPKPTYGPDKSKYELAYAVWNYVSNLAGRQVDLTEIYATNLCNEFLDHQPGSGTIFLPADKALIGIKEIVETVASGRFRAILPMAVQPFYYLCKNAFIDEQTDITKSFLLNATPKPTKAAQGLYVQTGKAPFLSVCGQVFHHGSIPVIPILHIKQWPLKGRMIAYAQAMKSAKKNVTEILR